MMIRLLVLLSLLLVPGAAHPLDFGVNKVRYHTGQKWRILQTEHFEIFHHPKTEALAQTTARFAEDAFLRVSQAFDYVPQKRIPLFVYGTGIEFQETNIIPAFLPEGVGGFTEAYKNRIVVPANGSYHELETVITHELVHAFQYNLIYGEGWRSFSLFKSIFVPTWVMEGSAEWVAENWESQGEMVLRDAVLHDRLLPLDLLGTFDHFEQVYMAYKESQSILEYVAQVYGREKVPLLVKRMAASQKPEAVIRSVLGVSSRELYRNWSFFIRARAWSLVKDRPSPGRYGEEILPDVVRAAVSPDSKRLAYLTPGQLGLWDPQTRKRTRLVRRTFQTQGSGLAWSPDGGSIAFCFRHKGSYRLGIVSVKDRQLETHDFPSLPVLYSPEWTPDGSAIVFTGYDHLRADLYRFDLRTGALDPLTRDEATESWARFSPDGTRLYFIREWKGKTRIHRAASGPDGKLTGESSALGSEEGEITSLHATSQGVHFTSDRCDRIFNLHRMDPEGGDLRQLTDTYADVISSAVAPDDSAFYAVVFERSRTSLYRFPAENIEERKAPPARLEYLSNTFRDAGRLLARSTSAKGGGKGEADPLPDLADPDTHHGLQVLPEVTPRPGAAAKAPPPVAGLRVGEASNIVQLRWQLPDPGAEEVEHFRVYRCILPSTEFKYLGSTLTGRKDRYVDYTVQSGAEYRYYVTAVNASGESRASETVDAKPHYVLASRDYRFRMSPDLLLFLAGYDSSFGFAGGGVAVMSDYLGDHRLALLGDAIPRYRSGLQAAYEYAGWRTTIGLNAYLYRNFFRLYDIQSGAVVDDFHENERGANLNFTYPFNVSTRLEYGVGTQRFRGSPSSLRFSEGLSNRYYDEVEDEQVANYYRVSLVRERRQARRFTPERGYAANFTFLNALPALDSNVAFRNLIAELQWYKTFGFLGGTTWANRWVGLRSIGGNPQTFFLGQDEIFQSFFTTLRGYGNRTYYGSHLALWNLELRYPVATEVDFPLRPLSFILLKDVELAFFTDTGVVADRPEDMTTRRLLNSVGGGLRLYNFLFQRALVQLRFDLAWRTDRYAPPVFHFNLMPLF